MSVTIWYSDEILQYLNEIGFVHVRTGAPVGIGFYKHNTAFSYNRKEKTYALASSGNSGTCSRTRRVLRLAKSLNNHR